MEVSSERVLECDMSRSVRAAGHRAVVPKRGHPDTYGSAEVQMGIMRLSVSMEVGFSEERAN